MNWLKGDIAAEVDKSYGDDKLGEFAAMVDENKSTFRSTAGSRRRTPKVQASGHFMVGTPGVRG